MHTLAPFDEALFQQHEEQRRQEYAQVSERAKSLRKEISDKWWSDYDEYLNSASWREKRERVLKRDNHECQACLAAGAEQVHHLNYKNLKNELLFELVAVCTACHERITRQNREARETVTQDDFETIVRRMKDAW